MSVTDEIVQFANPALTTKFSYLRIYKLNMDKLTLLIGHFLPAVVPNPEPVIVITPPEPLLGLTEETVGDRDEVNV